MKEKDYETGSRAAWCSMLQLCIQHLCHDSPDVKIAILLQEREEAVAALKRACEYHGDMDWDEDCYLSDIIENHLFRHLEQRVMR